MALPLLQIPPGTTAEPFRRSKVPMRYPQRHMSRKTVVVAVLVLGVGALAAAAAHARLSAPVRSDIELLVPAPPRVADKVQPEAPRAGAPLFATNSAARTRRDALDNVETVAAGAVPTAQSLAANAEARRAAAAG